MIPILYAKNESVFTHNGIGFLRDTIKATVTEERNGTYELSLQYPITGQWYDQITDGSIIKAKANEISEPQLFRIYKSSKPLKGVVTYSAEHISYDLGGIPTMGLSVENVTPQAAMTKAIKEAGLPSAFSAVSDIATLNSTKVIKPCSVRALLGGQAGSVLDVWGGEYEFDNFIIKLHSHRGADNGVTIEYGKNLKDIKQESNIAECYTHIMPYAVYTENDEDGEKREVYIYLSEKVLPLAVAENIGHSKAYIMDFSSRFGEGEEITEDSLRAKAAAYAETTGLGIPKVNITVSFVQLWQTEEYKNIAPLERVKMCDTVTVRFHKLGVSASAKVIKTVYDSLKEKYDSVTLGEPKSTLADTVKQQADEMAQIEQQIKTGQAKASEELKNAILNATSLITGHSGGYVVFNPAEKPQEILILDKPTIEEAVNVWRWNSGGLGHSSTGYNGEYSTAITMDGSIVADFINVGTLKAIDLSACTIKGGTMNINDKFIVTATGDATIAGKVTATSGTIGGCDIVEGVLKIKNANISEKLTAGNIDVSGVITAGGIAVKGDITAETTRATEAEGNLSSRITSTASEISSEVTRAKAAENSLSSRITQNANAITAKVSSTGGTNSSFAWSLTASGFTLISNSTEVMKVTSSGLNVVGNITATSGNFSNCTIDETCTIKGTLTATTICDNSDSQQATGSINFVGSGSTSLAQYNMRIVNNSNSSMRAALALTDSSGLMSASLKCTYTYMLGSTTVNASSGIDATGSLCNITGQMIGITAAQNGSDYIKFAASAVRSSVSITVTSDKKAKNSIADIGDAYEVLFDSLRPRVYKFNDGNSDRLHSGFIAQEVVEALTAAGLTTKDFAAVCISDKGAPSESWGLRYEEFIALNTREIQRLKARIAELEKQITA